MRGLLADVNLQDHLAYLSRLMRALDLMEILEKLGLRFTTFRDV